MYSFISASVLGLDDLNISLVPSGEKNAPPSYPNPVVTCLTLLPSIFIVYSSKSPVRIDVKTMRSPLGLTVGSASYPGVSVSCLMILPSRSAVNISNDS